LLWVNAKSHGGLKFSRADSRVNCTNEPTRTASRFFSHAHL